MGETVEAKTGPVGAGVGVGVTLGATGSLGAGAAGAATDESSLDGAIAAGLTVEFLPFERFAIGFDNELLYITNQDPLTRYAGTLGVSYAIPIKR